MAAARMGQLQAEVARLQSELTKALAEADRRPTPLCWEEQLKKEKELKRALRAERAVVTRKEEKIKELLGAVPAATGAYATRRPMKAASSAADLSSIKELEKSHAALFEDYSGARAFVSPVERAAAADDPQRLAELQAQGKLLALHSVECYLKGEPGLMTYLLDELLKHPAAEDHLAKLLGEEPAEGAELSPAAKVLQALAAKEAFGRVQDHWDVGLSVILKTKLRVSERKLDFIRWALTSSWDTHRGCFVRKQMGGVDWPAIKGSKATSAATHELREEWGVEQHDDGNSAHLDPEQVLIGVALIEIRKQLAALRAAGKLPRSLRIVLEVLATGDAFNPWGQGLAVTDFNLQGIIAGMKYSGDVGGTITIMLWEGNDKRRTMDQFLGPLAELISELLAGKEMTVEEEGCIHYITVIRAKIGGDMPWKNSAAGLASQLHKYGCLHCENDWRNWKKGEPLIPRRLIDLFRLAHRFHPSMVGPDGRFIAFDCPGCGKRFGSRADLDEPAIEDEREAEKYVNTHRGCRHKEALLICGGMASDSNATTADLFQDDVLHMTMSLLGKAMHEAVGRFIDTEDKAKALNEHLHSKGIMSTRRYTAQKQTAKSVKEDRPAFNGNTCMSVILDGKWKDVVARFTPAEYRDRATALFETLATWFWAVRMPCIEGFSMSEEEHGTYLDTTFDAFEKALISLSGPTAAICPYMHLAKAHLRRYAAQDVVQFSTQPSELRNKVNKAYLQDATNHHPGYNGRLVQALTAGIAERHADGDARIAGHIEKKARSERAVREKRGEHLGRRVTGQRMSDAFPHLPAGAAE